MTLYSGDFNGDGRDDVAPVALQPEKLAEMNGALETMAT